MIIYNITRIKSLFLLLLSNAVSPKRDKSIIHSGYSITIILRFTAIMLSKIYTIASKISNYYFVTRVITIFSLGIISRHIVNNYFNINVFVDYCNPISLIYYLSFGLITVSIFDIISHIENKGISSLLIDLRKSFSTTKSLVINYNKSTMGGITPSNVLFTMDSSTPEPTQSEGESGKSVGESSKSIGESSKPVGESSKPYSSDKVEGSPDKEISDKGTDDTDQEEVPNLVKFCNQLDRSYRKSLRDYIKREDLPDIMSEDEKDKIVAEKFKNYLDIVGEVHKDNISKPVSRLTEPSSMSYEEFEKDEYIQRKHSGAIKAEFERSAAEDDVKVHPSVKKKLAEDEAKWKDEKNPAYSLVKRHSCWKLTDEDIRILKDEDEHYSSKTSNSDSTNNN